MPTLTTRKALILTLVATRAGGRDILSQSFTVGSDMTGAIVWTLVPNIVGFENVDADTTGTPP